MLRWYLVFTICTSAMIGGYYAIAFTSTTGSIKTSLLPGKTSHGHYQIETNCNACHTPGMGVLQDVCIECHGAELKTAQDTHASSKFTDPTNAALLQILDATQCVSCHEEHVDERTSAMSLSVPKDYCYHCHQDTLTTRPSHANFAFDSCSNAGCHNFHDNRALYENFLLSHADDSDFASEPRGLPRNKNADPVSSTAAPVDISMDAPKEQHNPKIEFEWSRSSHFLHNVKCSQCHTTIATAENTASPHDKTMAWQSSVTSETCGKCHAFELQGFASGHHGMRIAAGLGPMTPKLARLPMHETASHRELNCSSCHAAHSYDTRSAAVDACLNCHADEHSLAYKRSSHYALWTAEVNERAPPGSGVSCATCHMPRVELDGKVRVQHNQNDNLRPNEKMIRTVCLQCHGLQFTLNSLADRDAIEACFSAAPGPQVPSINMAKEWFEAKERRRQERKLGGTK